jgi:hypothetical protein
VDLRMEKERGPQATAGLSAKAQPASRGAATHARAHVDLEGWKEDGWKEDGWKEDGWKEDGWKEDGWKEDGWKKDGWKEEGGMDRGDLSSNEQAASSGRRGYEILRTGPPSL